MNTITITLPDAAAVAVNGTPVIPVPVVIPPAPPAVLPPPVPTPPAPTSPTFTTVPGPVVIQVGPGLTYPSLTSGFERAQRIWNAGGSVHVLVDPGPPGYYNDDTGFHSPKWTQAQQSAWWPPFDDYLGTCVVEGTPGKLRPDLIMVLNSGQGDDLYYGKGWFNLSQWDVTLRRLRIVGCHRADGNGTYSAIRIEDGLGKGTFVLDDLVIESCDDGILGGSPGQAITLTNSTITRDGLGEPGRTHNVYIGNADSLIIDNLTSTNVVLGHHVKFRGKVLKLSNSTLGDGTGTESYCLDVPNGGTTLITNTTMVKSAGSDNPSMIHFGGADLAGFPAFNGSLTVAGLKLTAPTTFTRHPEWNGTARGLFNDGNLPVTASGVTIVGLTSDSCGFTGAQAG